MFNWIFIQSGKFLFYTSNNFRLLIKIFKFLIVDQPVEDEQTPMPRQESDIMPSQSSASLTSKSISDFENELTPPATSKINLMTPELVSALDRANVSSTSLQRL